MADVLPASYTARAVYRTGRGGISKVEKYQLVKTIVEMKKAECSHQEIAIECNKLLVNRANDRQYTEVTRQNITDYLAKLRKKHKAKIASHFRADYKDELKVFDDPIVTLTRVAARIELEMDYVQARRDDDGGLHPSSYGPFMGMVEQVKGILDTLQKTYKTAQPSFSVRAFQKNVEAVFSDIAKTSALTLDQKKLVVGIIQEHLLGEHFIRYIQRDSEDG